MEQQKVKKVYDSSGNTLYSERVPRGWNIYLKLASEHHRRLLGYVTRCTFIIERKRAKHLYRKMNAYGFNYEVLKRMKYVHTVQIDDEYESFVVPKEYIFEKGKFLNHKKQGFELQIFLNLKDLRRKTESNQPHEQQTLF